MDDQGFTVIENTWITMPDGTRLAARMWMPDGDGPFPAVLEYLPYRKRNGTDARDDSTYPAFARAGIVGVRVDIRGSGESDGVIDGEYTTRELADACEVIAWIAAQPWSNGGVGMMGISWGGFNCLQVAALQPPALKAVISIASTVDRYNDDIHYKNGTHLSAQLSWAGTMQGYQTRAPDPAIVGDAWRAMWMERLEGEPLFMEDWLAHQRRDAFWQHASICEDFGAVQVPSLVIAGWADGYRNTPLKAVEGMPNAKALIGPWVHKYPHFAWPHPRADFLGMAIDFWHQHLAGEDRGQDVVPQVRAYILDAPRPQLWREKDAGRWVAKDTWSAPEMRVMHVADGRLIDGTPAAREPVPVTLRSPLDTGVMQGEWFTLKPDAELPGDQRRDDAGSLVFDSAPLEEAVEMLGMPGLTLRVAADAPVANLAVRLVDLHPDGTATRISFGVLNLTHRGGDADPQPLPVGEMVEATVAVDACGYRLRPGHRLRLALSTALFPMILPPPTDVTLTVDAASLRLALPLLGAHRDVEVPAPSDPDPLPRYIEHAPSRAERRVVHDLEDGSTTYEVFEDTGATEIPEVGSIRQELRRDTWTIRGDDPLSLRGTSAWECRQSRGDWDIRSETVVSLACTATDWLVTTEVRAFEGEAQVFDRRHEATIPRDLM